MANNSYVQTNFQGGEWSPAYQARIDDPDYKKALGLCLNYIPNQEGSLTPRSGFMHCGYARNNAVARLLPFRFSYFHPYVAEFTGFGSRAGFLRFYANGIVVKTPETASVKSVSGSPPTFVIQDDRVAGTGLVPAEWATGDRVWLNTAFSNMIFSDSYLFEQEYILTVVSASAGTVRLTRAKDGVALSTAVSGSSGLTSINFYKIKDIPTKYEFPEGVRQVQETSQQVTGVTGTSALRVSPPERRVTYLYPLKSPQSISADQGGVQRGLITEEFVDGPYLDSFGTSIPLKVELDTPDPGQITVTVHGYDDTIVYMTGDLVVNYGVGSGPQYFMSLVDGNVGNALPTVALLDANWVYVLANETGWNSATFYGIGQQAAYLPIDPVTGEWTVYYSLQAGNTNKKPNEQPTYWSTSPPAWDVLEVFYAERAFVTDAGGTYMSITASASVGVAPSTDPTNWMIAPDIEAAVATLTNKLTGWLSAPLFYLSDSGGDISFSQHMDNPGRLIRLKAGPQPYKFDYDYAVNDLVNWRDLIYKSLVNPNLGKIPDENTTEWELQPTKIQWTWGQIIDSQTHMLQATIVIKGDPLPDENPIWEFRLGVYSDTTGWPTCGAYHEGRLALAGVMPNRVDLGCSGQGFNFTPTNADGTVSDANAIAATLNSKENETICGLASITEGLVILTSTQEHLMSASSLNDPLTPSSVQVRPTTAFSAFPIEVTRLPTGLCSVQSGGRRVLEYRNFIDMTSYQSRLNTSDLSRKCQHLTADGVAMTQFQSLNQPVLWCAPGKYLVAEYQPLTHDICTLVIDNPVVHLSRTVGTTLFGIAYSRTPEVAYAAPFSFEHGKTLAESVQQTISSIAIQRGPLETSDYLYACTHGSDAKARIEMMMPFFEQTPLEDTYNVDGTVKSFGTWSTSFFLDQASQPVGCKIALDGLSATFYGLGARAGETLSFVIRGKYVGEYLIAADGSVNVPFTTGTDTRFIISDLGRAMRNSFNYNLLEDGFDGGKSLFNLDVNGNSGAMVGSADGTNFLGYFGYKIRRRGQTLRPMSDGSGQPAFAKLERNYRAGFYLGCAHQLSFGAGFDKLYDLPLTMGGQKNTTPVGYTGLTTGIFRDSANSSYDFDGLMSWQTLDPWPGNVLAVGGFMDQGPG